MPSTDPGHIPGPIVIPNCVQVQLVWGTPNGRDALNVLHAQVAGGFTATTAIANAIKSALDSGSEWTALKAYFSTAASFKAVRLLDLRSASLAQVDSTSAAELGGSGDVALSPATALCVTERTARAGPGFRGRMFVPGWTGAAVVGGAIAGTAAVAALQDWADTIPAAFSGQAMTLALAQPARAAYVGSTGTAHAARAAGTVPVTELVVRNGFWDNQRRRGGRT